MNLNIKRIAVNTGGGDAPGLNAVIRAVVRAAEQMEWEVLGIKDSYDGLFEEDGVVTLNRRSVRGITHLGGTILGTTNRGNPLKWPIRADGGAVTYMDRSQEGLKVVGVPKTIDNDLEATSVTFGFHTAVDTATDAIGKLHSTAESHQRVMVVEVMGRNAGWIALSSGVAGTADVILIPEIPYDMDIVCEKIQDRYASGREFAIVVVAEGAFPKGSKPLFKQEEDGQKRLGGMAEQVAHDIHERTGRETRHLVLGHLQRGGGPNSYDRLLALRFGAAAVKLVMDGCFGCMVALDPPKVLAVPLEQAIARIKTVPLDSDIIETARAVGTCMGD